jgi:hypothetical protein
MTTIISSTPALVRFTVTGLTATIDAHLAGTLPLHRFAWELSTRIDTLGRLDAPSGVVTRLRWLHRTVERLHAELAEAGRERLDDAEQTALAAALVDLRTVLATLIPPTPRDPAGAGRPATAVTPAAATAATAVAA